MMLERSREEYERMQLKKQKLAISKTWFVQADLVLNKVKNIQEITEEMISNPKDMLKELNDSLEMAVTIFYEHDCDMLKTQCLLL